MRITGKICPKCNKFVYWTGLQNYWCKHCNKRVVIRKGFYDKGKD